MNEMTTITVLKETRERLEARKVHPRQSFDEVIQNLLDATSQREAGPGEGKGLSYTSPPSPGILTSSESHISPKEDPERSDAPNSDTPSVSGAQGSESKEVEA